MTGKRQSPQLVIEDGKPTAVILDIDEYERMLARLEEADDLAVLRGMRRGALKFRSLDEFLQERRASV